MQSERSVRTIECDAIRDGWRLIVTAPETSYVLISDLRHIKQAGRIDAHIARVLRGIPVLMSSAVVEGQIVVCRDWIAVDCHETLTKALKGSMSYV